MMTSSSSLTKSVVYDNFKIQDNPQISKLLEPDEQIIFSDLIPKINKYETYQDRIIVITSKNVYNIHPHDDLFTKLAFVVSPKSAVKRKIPIDKIWGITTTSQEFSGEFIIHVTDDYDYRYDAGEKFETLFKCLYEIYFTLTKKPLPLYVSESKDLGYFHTTDDDFRSGVDRKPKEERVNLNNEILEKGVSWIILHRKELIEEAILYESKINRVGGELENPGPSEERNPGFLDVEKDLPDYDGVDNFIQPDN